MGMIYASKLDANVPKMNVLIITSLFFPEISANSTRMISLAERLHEEGMDVTVVTAFPYYSKAPGLEYKNRFVVKDDYNGINVVRTYTSVARRNTIYRRLITFLSYMVSSAVYSVLTRKKFDIVISISPPFFTLAAAIFVSKIRRIPFIIDIQDLYPDTAIELGRLKNTLLIKIWRTLERIIYKSASAIVVISQGFRNEIVKKGISPNKVFIINSWVNIDRFNPEKVSDQKEALGLAGCFVVLFLGTIGYAQGTENIIETAAMVSKQTGIKFLFIGGGVEKKMIMQKTLDLKINNVLFLPSQPFQKIPSFINVGDVCLVHLLKRRLYKITIPSKTYEYMAMGKPIIMATQGEAASLVRDNNCGIVVKPEHPESLKRAILDIYENPQKAKKLGRNARIASLKYSEEILVTKYKEVVYQVGNGGLINE